MSNEITKSLYEKAAAWMADYEDPTLVMEDREMTEQEAERFLYHQAFDFMYDLCKIYSESDGGRN